MLLDEPTAALDTATELALLDTLGRLRDEGRTVIVVAHRPALVASADTVIEVPLLAPERERLGPTTRTTAGDAPMSAAPGPATWRLFRSASPQRWRLALAGLLGALALGSAVGLMATSAYLISKAALMPPILHLQVAIVGVRAFGIGRGVFRYGERLVGHDAAFRGLAAAAGRLYERLVPLAPATAGQVAPRRPAARGWSIDVDSALDLQLRVLLPFLAAVLVGVGSVVLAWTLLPAAGMILPRRCCSAASWYPPSPGSGRCGRATALAAWRGRLAARMS